MNWRLALIVVTFLIGLISAVVVNAWYGFDIVYTHLFYIPIILVGIWYPRYAILCAGALGIVHIVCDYFHLLTMNIEAFLRTAMFLIVAYVTSKIVLKKNVLFDELQTLNQAMLDMISQIDEAGIVRYVSPSVKTVLGYSPEQLLGKEYLDFVHPDDVMPLKQNFISTIKTMKPFRMDYRYRCADGKYVWIESLANPIAGQNKSIRLYVFGSRDITKRKELEEKLRKLSIRDSLTGLYNRFLFDEELLRFDTGRFDPVSVVMCDLDGLKLVNDNMGHSVGDQMLVAASRLLKEQFRASDIISRIGGDEFAVLLPECSSDNVEKLCLKLQQVMMDTCIGETNIPLMMSVGYATRSLRDKSIYDTLKEADINMYQQKVSNRQIFLKYFNKLSVPSHSE